MGKFGKLGSDAGSISSLFIDDCAVKNTEKHSNKQVPVTPICRF